MFSFGKSIYFFAFVAVISLNVGTFFAADPTCDELEKNIDGTVKQVLLLNMDIPLPTNNTLMEAWCSPFKTLSRRVGKLGKCLPPFLAQVVSVLGSGIKKPVKYICKANKQKAISNYACMTPEYLARFNKREAFFLNSLAVINKKVSDNDILPHFCCSVSTLLHEIYQLKPPKCKDSSLNTSKYIGDMVSLAVSDVVDLMCGTLRSYSSCQEKAPKALKFLRENANDSLDIRKASFVKRVLKVVEKMA